MAEMFRNEPPIDFSRRDNRERFAQTLEKVRAQFKEQSRKRTTGAWLDSVNPANPQEVVGRARVSNTNQAQEAIERTRRFFPEWRRTTAEERAEILAKAGRIMRDRRWELAAWEVFEVGKGWREADADVIEAIDYLNYYAGEMTRLGKPRQTQELPGETNVYFYEPRGIAAIIAPWNFPLAILTGMTAAALASGNCALIKPAEQSPVMAAHLMEILRAAGLPDDAGRLLQGGGELGAYLVRSPEIHLIAFTGSREVGLEILGEAYTHRPGQQHVKRVVCEMGGKNAVIIDNDADLDEAINHVIDSAFGYQGQKCSAASRLILVREVHDRFLSRLTEAVRSLKIGPPEDPRHAIGPVIEAGARERVMRYIRLGKKEAKCALEMAAPKEGYFVGPVVFSEVVPSSRIAREEIFGPVLAVMKARDFNQALEIANHSAFALAGGIFSRSPADM